MNKKAGIITFHNYDNYGAILQSYALYKHIEKIGASPEIINYSCKYISNPFSFKRLSSKGIFNYIYGVLGYIFYLPRRIKCNRFRKSLTYSEPVNSKTVKKLGEAYDVYIAGSDQIWNWNLTDFDKAYFLDFVTKGKKCSYAASIGEHLPKPEYRDEYSRLLNGFDHILVRESYGADVVEQLTGNRPDCTCDPTFLMTAEEWAELIPSAFSEKPYILTYQLGVNTSFVNFVRRMKKKTGLSVSYIPFPLVGMMRCRPHLTDGPLEWLYRFKNAQYVITDSFHGVVFAILFHKPFFVLADGHHKNKRVQELLSRLHLEDRIICDEITDDMLTKQIDYTFADEQLKTIRQDSIDKLKKILQ